MKIGDKVTAEEHGGIGEVIGRRCGYGGVRARRHASLHTA